TYALIEAGAPMVPPALLIAVGVLGAAALAAFIAVERRSAHPMLPLDIFRSARFTATNLVTALMYGALGPLLFLLVLYLQEVMACSAVQAGAASLPSTGLMLLLSGQSGRLAGRLGRRVQMAVGPALVAVGMVMLSRLSADSTYLADVLPGVLV